ncbi:ornithine carbamoyltransferase [Lachancea thermotolerans CBS 6340]|uniref:ornithine carbamoyltransferase n=1 Tax=Lachancea thermotolerans (strain ATCC 56472 / CBS 6340 / NRRL Y-8284) TaxID=559295 RepID=C5E316_LACTC|nr:KLTH0H09526p [Lachancea thermotolerans CBS 6340]CAR30427.1 KLTH0H09526p [Lachancea thermotolerans CBS 6340]
MRHLVSIKDLTDKEFQVLVDRAEYYKKTFKCGDLSAAQKNHVKLLGKTAALIFSKRSTRTRVSTEGALSFFGAQPMFLGKDDIQLGVNESFYDTTRVVSSMVSCIFARVNKHSEIQELTKHSSVPIINSLCDMFHPLQAICDILTIKEHLDYTKNKLKVAWIGDANNVINDMAIACLKVGIDVSISTPSGIEMDPEIIKAGQEVAKANGSKLIVTHSSTEAATGANVLVTDTFISMGEEYARVAKLKQFQGFQINSELCSYADPNYKFMHCLPRHHEEVTDDIFYSDHSIVFDEAENRLYAAMAAVDVFVINKGNFSAGPDDILN